MLNKTRRCPHCTGEMIAETRIEKEYRVDANGNYILDENGNQIETGNEREVIVMWQCSYCNYDEFPD